MTTKKFSGSGDFDHIQQRAHRAIAILAVLRAAMMADESAELGAYPIEVLDLIDHELQDIAAASEEAGRTLESQAVTQ